MIASNIAVRHICTTSDFLLCVFNVCVAYINVNNASQSASRPARHFNSFKRDILIFSTDTNRFMPEYN